MVAIVSLCESLRCSAWAKSSSCGQRRCRTARDRWSWADARRNTRAARARKAIWRRLCQRRSQLAVIVKRLVEQAFASAVDQHIARAGIEEPSALRRDCPIRSDWRCRQCSKCRLPALRRQREPHQRKPLQCKRALNRPGPYRAGRKIANHSHSGVREAITDVSPQLQTCRAWRCRRICA